MLPSAWIPLHIDTSYVALRGAGYAGKRLLPSVGPPGRQGLLIPFSVPKSEACCTLSEGLGEKNEVTRTSSSSGPRMLHIHVGQMEGQTIQPHWTSSLILIPHTHPSGSVICLNLLPFFYSRPLPPPQQTVLKGLCQGSLSFCPLLSV